MMKNLTILFDADDVAENLVECWVSALNERYGTTVTIEDVTEWDISKAFPTLTRQQVYDILKEDELWNRLEPMPGSQEVLQKFYDEGHQLYMVTATNYHTVEAKMERIFELFPWLDWDHVIIAGNKQMIRGDVLIDDNPENLIGGDYLRILYDRPHNRSFRQTAGDIYRLYSWENIYDFLHKLNGELCVPKVVS